MSVQLDAAEAPDLDEYLPLPRAAEELPRRRAGRKTSTACVYRWTNSGLRGVRLRYTQVGGTRCTTRRWLREFFDALADASSRASGSKSSATVVAASGVRSPSARARAHEIAERDLDRLGV